MASRRPIDPPDLPAWRKGREDEDDTPTLSGMDDPFDSEETQWEALPPSDSVAARWAAVSPAGFMTETDPGARVPDLGQTSAPGVQRSDRGAILTPQPLGQPKEDPRALAQRLAAEAKARLAQPNKASPMPAEDPRELAKRLAAEAKARTARTPAPAPVAEDPRALAKRLTKQAKAKARSATPPGVSLARHAAGRPSTPNAAQHRTETQPTNEAQPQAQLGDERGDESAEPRTPELAAAPMNDALSAPEPTEDPRALAIRLAAEAKARMTPGPAPVASEPPAPVRSKKSLAERAVPRPKSAKEILEAAMRGEVDEAPSTPEVFTAPVSEAAAPAPPVPAAPVPEAPVSAAPVPAASDPEVLESLPPFVPSPKAAPAPPPPAALPATQTQPSAAAVLLDLLPGAAVEAPMPVARPEVFQAVWRAHRTRAQHEQDWSIVAAASVLIDAAARVPAGAFVAARVTLGGQAHAVFADVERKVILAIISPADVYLAGLSG